MFFFYPLIYFPFLIWTFISLFYLDYYVPFLFLSRTFISFFRLLFLFWTFISFLDFYCFLGLLFLFLTFISLFAQIRRNFHRTKSNLLKFINFKLINRLTLQLKQNVENLMAPQKV